MANEPIALTKNIDFKKVRFPCFVSEKIDGIAVRINSDGNITRQGKALESIPHIQELFDHFVKQPGWNIVGELYVECGMPFKEASGIIRRQQPDSRIKLMMYDIFHEEHSNIDFQERLKHIHSFADQVRFATSGSNYEECITYPKMGQIVKSKEELDTWFDSVKRIAQRDGYYPEGYVVRNLEGEDTHWAEGKRTWGMMRHKDKPTKDLVVVSVEEATANKDMVFLKENYTEGQGLGAIGRINVQYGDLVIGVGPGRMAHAERRAYWYNQDKFVGKIVEVEYMHDPSYEALRQPTYQRIRHDKTEPDTKGE